MAQIMAVKKVILRDAQYIYPMFNSRVFHNVSVLLKVFLGPSASRDIVITVWPQQKMASKPHALPEGLSTYVWVLSMHLKTHTQPLYPCRNQETLTLDVNVQKTGG